MSGFNLGDKVAVYDAFGEAIAIKSITELKKRYFVLSDGTKWCDDGLPYPRKGRDAWHNRHVYPANDEHYEKVARRRLTYQLKNQWNPDELSVSSLRKIWNLIEEEKTHGKR